MSSSKWMLRRLQEDFISPWLRSFLVPSQNPSCVLLSFLLLRVFSVLPVYVSLTQMEFHICQEWSLCPLFPVQFSMSHSSWIHFTSFCLDWFQHGASPAVSLSVFSTLWGLVLCSLPQTELNWRCWPHPWFTQNHHPYSVVRDVIL